ncbi:MAG: peptidoglycan glycosyltransferase [Bacteroidetes bacterium]|nr:MAG: peptidoglycan glycosyltransferase [Bacteroidota bacterium]PTM15155.1 MAG: peptidoglycan glycosyltransferase [Bacteroidota bacterium]
MDIKNEVLYRVYFLLFGLLMPAAGFLLYRTINIAVINGEFWRERGEQNYVMPRKIQAERGNIYSADGSLLATSVPYFDLYFDPFASAEADYYKNLDTLAYCLATYVDNSYTVGGFREYLLSLRDTSVNIRRSRHILLKKQVSFEEKRRIESFPLFNLGKYRGGLIAEKLSERKRPFGLLARRVIGYNREERQPVGLEGRFDSILGGEPGSQMMIKVDPRSDLWLPLENLSEVEPKSGNDLVTTIDVNLQDITEEALLRGMRKHRPEWGTAIVMDVATGAIKAMANLGRDDAGKGYFEMYNYAIAMATEPGSTFKLATIMALLEDGYVKLTDSVDIEKGNTIFSEIKMEDASSYSFKLDSTTVQRAFEISSNVGMAKLVDRYYNLPDTGEENKGAYQFIQRMRDFNLDLPTGIELDGEANPYFKNAWSRDDQWSMVTLPWMATGYELRITPLQLLTFYNAVANNGRLMKPYLVSAIEHNGEVIEEFRPTVVQKAIASKTTIEKARLLLEGVVKRGTAMKLQTNRYSFAGKTGTAQVDYTRGSKGTRIGGYQASFAGYFPADHPKYSCIVVVYKPQEGGIYGSDVAGPIFREIADKCFNSMMELHDPLNQGPRPVLYEKNLPSYEIGRAEDMRTVLDYLGIPHYGEPAGEMILLTASSDSLLLQQRNFSTSTVPSVIGMGLRDAVYILENRGLRVKTDGAGRVVRQSIRPGTKNVKQTIILTLG